MERPRARSGLVLGTVAFALAAVAGGAFEAPRDLSTSLQLVADREAAADPTPVPADEMHHDSQPAPSMSPGPATATPPPPTLDPHAGDMGGMDMGDPGHDEETASPQASDGHDAMPDMGDGAVATAGPPAGGHDEPSGGHADASAAPADDSAAHGDEEPPAERPRAVVFGGFIAINALVFAAAGLLRRRDRAAAAHRSARASDSDISKDASR